MNPSRSARKSEPDSAADSAVKPSDRSGLWQQILSLPFLTKIFVAGALALLLRVWHVLQTQAVPTAIVPIGDAQGYIAWAERIVAGNWYGSETFYQAPCYPYFLAVLMQFGLGVLGIRIVQALLGSVAVVLLGWATGKTFDERIGVLSAFMLALYAPGIYYDGIIQKASLASFLLCAVIASLAWWRVDAASRTGNHDEAKSEVGSTAPWLAYTAAALCGFLLSLLMLTRENALLWLPLPALWAWLAYRSQAFGFRAAVIAAYFLGTAIVLFPVAARNASLGGEWSPTTFQAGPNFYIGNNASASGIYEPLVPGHETPLHERSDAVRLAEQSTGQEMSAREVSQFWMGRSWQEIRDQPVRWIQLMLMKSLMAVNGYEVPDVESMEIYRQQSPPLILLSRWWHFGVLCPLAFVGILARVRHWRDDALLLVMTLVMLGAVVLFFILGRYRLPLVPLLIPFAAVGVIQIIRWLREREWRTLALRGMLPLVVVAVICNLPVFDRKTLESSSLMNVAIAAAQKQDYGTSIRLFRQAAVISPELPELHFNLGRALAFSGQPMEAISELRTALSLQPDLGMVDSMLGQLHEQTGNPAEAVFHYRRALQIDPSDQAAAAGLQRLR